MTAREPCENVSSPVPAVDSITAEMVIRMTAAHVLEETFSPNRSSAISVVATISKLFRRETDDAVEFRRPYISSIGAAMSRTTMPMMYGMSPQVRGRSSLRLEGEADLTASIPIPAPR